MSDAPDWPERRQRMVAEQLRARGIEDERVLAAMSEVPRERFVPEQVRGRAYRDGALPIGEGQTISQPWMVAAICSALGLTGSERVLEIGTGSGYSAAVLARLAAEVVTIERIDSLAQTARAVLEELGYDSVEVIVGDGSVGAPERGPYDAIAVHAAAPGPPPALLSQLSADGVLVAPVESRRGEMLTAFQPGPGDQVEAEELVACRFVPLLGTEGYPESS